MCIRDRPRTPRKPKYMLIVVQRIACDPLIATAPAKQNGGAWSYRFWRLSNRALAATVGKCRCGPLGRGNYKILDIRIGAGFCPALSALRLRRPHFFQQRKKWGKERRQKPMVFGFPSPSRVSFVMGRQGNRLSNRPAAAPTQAKERVGLWF